MAKKKTTFYLTPHSDKWLTEQSKEQGISKNDIIQILINKAMQAEAAPK